MDNGWLGIRSGVISWRVGWGLREDQHLTHLRPGTNGNSSCPWGLFCPPRPGPGVGKLPPVGWSCRFCQSASIGTHVDSFTKLKIFAIPLPKKFVDPHHPLLDLRILEFLEPNEPVEDILSN